MLLGSVSIAAIVVVGLLSYRSFFTPPPPTAGVLVTLGSGTGDTVG
jgi:hypothetical protein